MVKKCLSCDFNNRDDAAFCASCGASMTGAGPLPTAPSMHPVPSVRVVTPGSPGSPVRVPVPGQCFYHPNLPAVFACNRCGRSICRDDSKDYRDLVLCPQCYQGVVPMSPQPAPSYGPPPIPAPSYGPPPIPAPSYGPPPIPAPSYGPPPIP
ncbi:MAG: hypothetical protein ABSD41_13015, partial [Candidatus Bathyarchaeia archaeon]